VGDKYEYDEDGNLKILDQIIEKAEISSSARNTLLLSNHIIEARIECLREKPSLIVELTLKVPDNFNTKYFSKLYMETKEKYKSFSKAEYKIENNFFTLTLESGMHIHSFIKYFLEYIDSKVSQEIILVDSHFPEWRPNLKEKIPETEFIKIMDRIVEKRLEFFQNDTGKYRDEVMKRDRYKCVKCGTDGIEKRKGKNGLFRKNPLQIHHLDYYKDSPDSLLTLCRACHYTLHRRLYIETGAWSTKHKKMELHKENKH
tara:strand:- start:37 stop:810 length:774 start_codon:yes stop_codon:yes gene_type:complete